MPQPNQVPTDSFTPVIYKPVADSHKIKMLVYGPPGVGKTTLAATADLHPLTKKVLFINVEGGMLSVSDMSRIGLKEAPDVTDMGTFDNLDKIFWFLAKGNHPYQTVCIDSLSELQMVNLESIVEKQVGATSRSGGKRESLDDIWQEDYGVSTQQIRRLIRKFRDLPMHVIFTCLDRTDMDKQKNVFVGPALTPKVATAAMGYMDIVAYMYADSATDEDGQTTYTRKLLCQPYDRWIAKDRSPGGKLGMVIEDPSIPKIMNMIIGGTK